MNAATIDDCHRILVIDDNPSIHDDIRKILCQRGEASDALTNTKLTLFGDDAVESNQDDFEIDSAFQGEEGMQKVLAASTAGRPYSLAFVDVRMPPGWDGVETITRIWQSHPDLQVVICTAYSDYSWESMVRQVGRSSSMVVLKKPFDNIEVLQLAHALTEKWNLNRQVRHQLRNLDQLVDQRTTDLRAANAQLKREMTERLQVEKALVLSEERFSKAFNANPIPLAIQSLRRETITDANQGFQDLTGYSRTDLIGRTPRELNLWAEPETGHPLIAKGRIDRSVRNTPCRLRTRSNTVRDVLLSAELIELNDEPCLLTVAQDITEHLLLEKQLRHSQKMEAVGQLAAGIAHDFNNMLTVIQGNASLVIADAPADAPDRPLMEGIVEAAQRSARLVRQLLTFSHKQVVEARAIHVSDMLASLSEMLPRMLGEQIAVTIDIAPGLPPIAVDVGMIEQLLMNLAVNARDAMPQGGQLTISAKAVEFSAAELRANEETQPGRFLCLGVSDTGCGIPPEVLPRIFEPFFTTKPVGVGTGLGLATSYGIARQHQGWIAVQSEVGQGTTFRVYFPFGAVSNAPSPDPWTEEQRQTRGTETILVVEDEEFVRRCVTAILKSQGYSVLIACDGIEALSLWNTHSAEVDLLLTDMVMPNGFTGLELAERLLAQKPSLKVIYTSGYSPEFDSTTPPFVSGHGFLAKPYQSGVLLRALRERLDRPR